MSDSWTLAIETTGLNASLALFSREQLMAVSEFQSDRTQEQDLFEPLQEILRALPTKTQLARILVGTGPGSYNGARVGIAAAQAISQVHTSHVIGLCSFEAVAEVQKHQAVLAVGDARRGGFFTFALAHGKQAEECKIHDKDEFQTTTIQFGGPLVTLEDPDKLPTETPALLVKPHAKHLLAAYTSRSPAEQFRLIKTPPETFYLRPPHITRPKKSFPSVQK